MRNVYHIQSTGEGDVSHERVIYVSAIYLVFQMNDYIGYMDIFCRLGQHNACTLDACLDSIRKQTLYHNDHMHSCYYLKQKAEDVN